MPVAELRAASVPIAVAGDNCCEPFPTYGGHDMLDFWRQSVRVLHLDRPFADALSVAKSVPARIIGIDARTISAGANLTLSCILLIRSSRSPVRPDAVSGRKVVSQHLPLTLQGDAATMPLSASGLEVIL